MNDEIIQQIRSKADIVEIIRSYIPVTKKGKSFVAVCPFHDDHDPSMSISSDKQIYKCFVCGAGGNVFTFVKDFEKISFMESVQRVAGHIHFEIEDQWIKPKEVVDPKIQAYRSMLTDYIRFTRYSLASETGTSAKDYLSKRGLPESVLDAFEIGYNPSNNAASTFLFAKGYTTEQGSSTNVMRINEYGTKDVFENRIVFPIHDANGNPIGFTARTMDPNEPSKYINTAETPLFIKGKTLYNYHRALRSIKLKGFVLVVEGVMDAIAYHQAGFENVVASLGTAFTKDQIRLLQNASSNVVLSFDADEAGQNATLKVGRLLLEHRLNVSVVVNTLGKDPDEILRSHSKEVLSTMVDKRVGFTEFLFENSLKRLDLQNYTQKKEFARLMMGELPRLKDAFDQAHFLERLQNTTGFTLDQLNLLVPSSPIAPKTARLDRPSLSKKNEIDGWAEKEILGQMLVSQQAMQIFRKELGYFMNPLYQKAALLIMNYYRKHDQIVIADFINDIEEESLVQLITHIVESEIYYNSYSQMALWDALSQVKINTIDARIAQFKQEHKDKLELESDPETMRQYETLLKERRELKKRNEDHNGERS